MAERGGHGRDGPVYPRDSVAAGGNASRAGAGVERERTTCTTSGSGYKVGEEELPMEVPGRYEKMRVLGRGSFGAVTLVKDHRDSKLYAMKTLNCADKLEERETAMAEVRALRSVVYRTYSTSLVDGGRKKVALVFLWSVLLFA